MYKIGIIGLGLMGGSLAKAFSKLEEVEKIVAYDQNEKALENAKEDGTVQEIAQEIDKKFQNLDFIFICTPVNTIYEYAKKLKEIVNKKCIISDIGSTKKNIVEQIDKLDLNFVGAHPMIGSEKYGYEFSKEDLYVDSYYLLTKTDKTKLENIQRIKELLEKIRAIPLEIDLDRHDFSVGVVSHVPHIVASGLVNLAKNLDDENKTMKTIAAGGFKDITRIASANSHMWQNICQQNKEEIVVILEEFENIIREFKNNIDSSEKTYEYFETAKNHRDSFVSKNKVDYVTVKVKNKAGVLAEITTICAQNSINISNINVLRTKEKEDGIIKILFENEEEKNKSIELLKKHGYEVSV